MNEWNVDARFLDASSGGQERGWQPLLNFGLKISDEREGEKDALSNVRRMTRYDIKPTCSTARWSLTGA